MGGRKPSNDKRFVSMTGPTSKPLSSQSTVASSCFDYLVTWLLEALQPSSSGDTVVSDTLVHLPWSHIHFYFIKKYNN